MESWRPVVGREGLYEVSDLGRVRSLDRIIQQVIAGKFCSRSWKGRILRPGTGPTGYPHVKLGAAAVCESVHSLVAAAFLGPRPDGHQVRHKDGERHDPNLRNLEYGTDSDNKQDAIRHGTSYASKAASHGHDGRFLCKK